MSRPNRPIVLPVGPDQVASSFVRNYLMTGGHTRPRHLLSLETELEPGPGKPGPELPHECWQIMALCQQRRRTVTELAGTIHRPVNTVKILVSFLLDARALRLPVTNGYVQPADDSPLGQRPTRQLLEAFSAALKAKWSDAESYQRAG